MSFQKLNLFFEGRNQDIISHVISYLQISDVYNLLYSGININCPLPCMFYMVHLIKFDLNFDNVMYLNLSYQGLSSFKFLFKNLRFLDCSNNKIMNLDGFFDNLHILKCKNNLLTYLPVGMNKLRILKCQNNFIRDLPSDIPNLIFLNCKNNQVRYIPYNYNTLKMINYQLNPGIKLFSINQEDIDIISNKIIKTEYNYKRIKLTGKMKLCISENDRIKVKNKSILYILNG